MTSSPDKDTSKHETTKQLSRDAMLELQNIRNAYARFAFLGCRLEDDLAGPEVPRAVEAYPEAKEYLLEHMADTRGVKFFYIPGPHNDRNVPCLIEISNPLVRPLDSVLGTTAFSAQQIYDDEGPIYSIFQWYNQKDASTDSEE